MDVDIDTPIAWAVIYIVTLRAPEDDTDPLIGTSYVGQAVRIKGSSAESVVQERWNEEKKQALKTPKNMGFIAALQSYGHRAFKWEVLKSMRGPRDDVQRWANEQETAEISNRGGTLRSMSPSCSIQQTFNLMPGGKGIGYWQMVEAFCSAKWNRFKLEMQEFVHVHQTAYVKEDYRCSNGYRLGLIAHCVRRRKVMIDGRPDGDERAKWLESLHGWSWNNRESEEYSKIMSQVKKTMWANMSTDARDVRKRKQQATWCRDDHAVSEKHRQNATERRITRIEEAKKIAQLDPHDKRARIVGQYYIDSQNRLCVAVKNGKNPAPKLNRIDHPERLEKMRKVTQTKRQLRIDELKSEV